MNRHEPFTGFGDDTNTSVKFSLVSDSGRITNWIGGARINQFPIPNSGRVITQNGGREPSEMTCGLLFHTIADFDALDALQGYRATLRYLANVTSSAGGVVETLLGTRYLVLSGVILMSLETEAMYRSGQVVATATFQRSYDAGADTVGFARFAEDIWGLAPLPGLLLPLPGLPPLPNALPLPGLLLPLNGTLSGTDQAGSLTASGTGAIRYVNNMLWSEEGTTNLHANPVLNTVSTGWRVFGSPSTDVTGARVTTQTDMAPAVWEMLINVAGSFRHQAFSVGGLSLTGVARTYTPSATVKASRAQNVTMFTTIYYTNGYVDTAQVSVALTTTKQRIVLPTVTTDPARTYTGFDVWLSAVPNSIVGDRFWMVEGQIEEKASATSFGMGSLGTGYSWTGTAHASSSTRAATRVFLPYANRLDPQAGEALVRFRRTGPIGIDSYLFATVNNGTADSYFIGGYISQSGGDVRLIFRNGAETLVAFTSTVVVPLNTDCWLSVRWNGTLVEYESNLFAKQTQTRTLPTLPFTGTNLNIGARDSTGFELNGLLNNVVTFLAPLADEQRRHLRSIMESRPLVWSDFGGGA